MWGMCKCDSRRDFKAQDKGETVGVMVEARRRFTMDWGSTCGYEALRTLIVISNKSEKQLQTLMPGSRLKPVTHSIYCAG